MALYSDDTTHVIWVERLRWIDDSAISDESHSAIDRANLREAITSFRVSTYQPGGVTRDIDLARVPSALADTGFAPLRVASAPLPHLAAFPPDHLLLFFGGRS